MNKTTRIILSALLVVALLLAALIIPAGAADTNNVIKNTSGNSVYLLGDADRDGDVSAADVVSILRWDVGISKDSVDADWLLYTGDVDRDGKVDILDATYIRRWLAGLYVPYSVGEPLQNDTSPEEIIWPLPGRYYPNVHSEDHPYITVSAPAGTPVLAAESGVVVAVANTCTHSNSFICMCNGGYGNHVWIRTDSGIEMIYGYLIATNVEVGDTVKAGDTIGYVGETGYATGPSLLFECRQNGVKINPLSLYIAI